MMPIRMRNYSKCDPLSKSIEGLASIGCGLDGTFQLAITDIVQEEDGVHDSSEFAEGEVKLVLPTASAKASQYHGSGYVSGFDRNSNSEHIEKVSHDKWLING